MAIDDSIPPALHCTATEYAFAALSPHSNHGPIWAVPVQVWRTDNAAIA